MPAPFGHPLVTVSITVEFSDGTITQTGRVTAGDTPDSIADKVTKLAETVARKTAAAVKA